MNIKNEFTFVIVNDRKDNTYKFALGRFILDFVKDCNIEDLKISYETIAESFLRYYWNQVVVYKIKQDFKTTKKPEIVKIIEENSKNVNELYDQFFSKEENIFIKNKLIKEIYMKCLRDVIPRFQRNGEMYIYEHNAIKVPKKPNGFRYYLPKEDFRYIILKKEAIKEIKENINQLYKVVILEWAKFLEKTNFTPRLIEKVERLNNPERNSLEKYRKILLEIDNKYCFYCHKKLDLKNKGEIHIDHFIPWSYMFEDNEWNLVLSCRDCNIRKNNSLPSKHYLSKIKERNKILPENYKVKEDLIDQYYENCKKAGFYEKTPKLYKI